MGLADIAALVVECGPAEARAMEASNNLGAARMTPLQTAVFVASWARDYYARHPERRPGVFKGNRFTNKEKVVTVKMTVTTAIADALGVSDATVFRALRAGESLTPEEVARLEAAPRKLPMQDLMVLGKIGDPEERAAIIERLAASGKGTAAQVRSRWRAEKRGAPKPLDRVEEAFRALSKLWERAPAAARRRFAEEHFASLDPMLEAARRSGPGGAGGAPIAFTRKGGGAA
jgi:ParB family chromosome partitioning protein